MGKLKYLLLAFLYLAVAAVMFALQVEEWDWGKTFLAILAMYGAYVWHRVYEEKRYEEWQDNYREVMQKVYRKKEN